MKKVVPVLLLAVVCLSSCMRNIISGSGSQAAEQRTITAFSGIDISAPIAATINIQEGATPSVQLSGYANLVKYIKTEVKDNTLSISVPEGIDLNTDQKVKAIITLPNISLLSISGAADAALHGNVKGSDFKLEVSGATEITAENISVANFSTEIAGAANVSINGGNTQVAKYELSGASKLKAFGMVTDETTVELSGAGLADVNAQKKLDTHLSGVGAIHYKGHPAITSEKSGIGTISDAN